jgi:hypothetical protein
MIAKITPEKWGHCHKIDVTLFRFCNLPSIRATIKVIAWLSPLAHAGLDNNC